MLKAAKEQNLVWPLDPKLSDPVLGKLLFPEVKAKPTTSKRMPDFEHIRKELLRNGVNKKLLWTKYLEECRLSKEEPLMYSQFCYYIQQDEQKRRATMHINRKPAEQVEVDWAGDPAHIIDPDTGEILDAQIFVGVMTYSQYPYVEAFMDQKQASWIAAHIHMYEYFGGVAKSSCRTTVALLWIIIIKAGMIHGSMPYIRKWQNTMAPPLFRHASVLQRISLMLRAV